MIFIVVIYLWCFIFIYYTYVEEKQNRYHDLFVVNYVLLDVLQSEDEYN